MVTLLVGIISVKSVPKSLPTLTLFLVCDLRKVSQTLYADSFACITTCWAARELKQVALAIRVICSKPIELKAAFYFPFSLITLRGHQLFNF
jgi:hypothetical protein